MTFSNISQEDIKDRYTTQDIPVLLSELPSTTFRSDGGNGIGYNYVNIRGFDQRRVAVSINGVPQNDPGDHNVYWIDFPDLAANLQDIQVQRGAGLSHYGSAAIGGSVDLVTSNYSPTPRYSLFAGVGSYGTRKYSIEAHTGLLSDRYSLYGRLSRIETDGYRDLSWVRLNSFFVGGAYFGLEQTLRLHAYGGPLEDHLAYYGVPKSYVDSTEIVRRQNLWLARNDETERFHQPQLQLLHDWQLSPTARLSNTFFYIRGTGYFDFTGDWWADFGYLRLDDDPEVSAQLLANSLHPSSIFVRDSILRWYVGKQQWGWVPRISLDHGRGTVDVGGDLRVHTAKHWGRLQKADADSAAMDASGNPLPINMPDGVVGRHRYYEYNTDKLITSAFVHSTYDLSPRVTLSGDLQCVYKCYTMRGEKFVTTPRRFDVPFSFVNPRVGANV
ncbi:MAG: TonB-dependent receptor, partial [Candidatus Latescibacteria bacterium]|nr:TonB-dependent receptor [Candidatus Latescibacterota bacterium]